MAGNDWLMLGVAGCDLSQLSGNIYGAGNNHLHTCYNPAFFTMLTPTSSWKNSEHAGVFCAPAAHWHDSDFTHSNPFYLPSNTGE